MKQTVSDCLNALSILNSNASRCAHHIKFGYAMFENIERLDRALKPIRNQASANPLIQKYQDELSNLESKIVEGKIVGAEADKLREALKEEHKEAVAADKKLIETEIDFEPYQFPAVDIPNDIVTDARSAALFLVVLRKFKIIQV